MKYRQPFIRTVTLSSVLTGLFWWYSWNNMLIVPLCILVQFIDHIITLDLRFKKWWKINILSMCHREDIRFKVFQQLCVCTKLKKKDWLKCMLIINLPFLTNFFYFRWFILFSMLTKWVLTPAVISHWIETCIPFKRIIKF